LVPICRLQRNRRSSLLRPIGLINGYVPTAGSKYYAVCIWICVVLEKALKLQVLKWRISDWAHFWMGRVPITKWLPVYNWKEDLRADIIGGMMLSIMSLPQALAYGYLVGVPPIYGLITTIFGPIIYTIFGTSKHTSPGCFAIVALMVGSVVEEFGADKETQTASNITDVTSICCKTTASTVSPEKAVDVATSVTLLIGLWQIFFGLLNAGILAVWLSDHLVQGLTSGAAVHVLTSQLKSMTGIDGVPPTTFRSFQNFYLCFFKRLHTIKIPSAVISVTAIFLLLLSNYFIDPILKNWTNVKFPMEFVLITSSIMMVSLVNGTHLHIDVPIVGQVESGFPPPRMPSLARIDELVWHAITIAIISFVIHIALAKLISRKLNYEVDANQEWFALGAMNSIACLFGCFAGGSSLGRTMMQVKFGTKSQVRILSCLEPLDLGIIKCAVLASIIVVAMKDLFIQLFRGLFLCRESIVDFMIFLVTLVAVVLINVNNGLIIGISFALLSVVFRTQWADSTCMGRIPGTSDFKGLGHYRSAEEIPGIKVFRFEAPLYFANAELFILSVYNACGLNPVLGNKLRLVGRRVADASCDSVKEDQAEHVITQLTHIIIDCSTIPYVDLMGKDALAQTYSDYSTIDITVLMANCKAAVRQLFETTDFYQKVPKNRMFVNVNDAVIQALKEQRTRFPDDTAPQTQKPPIAHSPPQRTIISLKEEREEKTTQSACMCLFCI
uniref:STAS domain-containing protein n=1 Tax=Angiostrongylus cantonensis TaxID=6313 RepID=A0A158P6H0_ANGCA